MIAAVVLGALVGLLNHVAVFAGMAAPPAGYEPAYLIRNLDIPQYLTWAALARGHWLLPNGHAPWITEPALFQPMLQLVGKSGLSPVAGYYIFQFLMYTLAAWSLLFAADTFCRSGKERLYAAIAMAGALPLKLMGWAVAKWLGASQAMQLALAYGVIEYSYETADGFLRGGLSNSFTLSFGTSVTLLSFAGLTRYLASGDKKWYKMTLFCTLFGALLHPFEVFLVVFGATFPLWKDKRLPEIVPLALAAGFGILPYLVQTVRSPWLRDASDLAQWHMTSPAWVLLIFGIPALGVCWLMAMRFRSEGPEETVLQSWFLSTVFLPLVPAVPVAIHLFDGFTYGVAFLLVRKVSHDPLFQRYRNHLRPAAYGWAAISAAVLATMYVQLYNDGKSSDPLIGRPAVIAADERRMLDWMKQHLPPDRLVLAPVEMAPWVAALPMKALASHDVFSITFDEQRNAVTRFQSGDTSVIGEYGVSYVVSEQRLASGIPLFTSGALHLYEMPGQTMKPYPGRGALTGASPRNAFRQWVFAALGAGGN